MRSNNEYIVATLKGLHFFTIDEEYEMKELL
jgi:hypothetical protein